MAGHKEEEVWRLPKTAKGRDTKLFGGSGSHRSPSLSSAAKERLNRIANRAPEVMVKVTGRTRGVTHLKAHLDYVTRNGKLLAETQDGEQFQDRGRLRELHDDWLLANAAEARGRNTPQAAQSVGIILSMPPGAPRDRVHDAARTWARETFKDKHDWIMVRHDDKDHPHVHVSVRAVGNDGRRLAPGPDDLQVWRERFARELRRLGVAAEATPRQARGKVQRSDRSPVHHVVQRGAKSIIRTFQHDDAMRAAKAPVPPQPRDWQRDIQARQEGIRKTYLEHASELTLGDAADQRLAKDIERFVADMPVPLTRRQALAVELRRVMEQRTDPVAAHIGQPAVPASDLHRANRQGPQPALDQPQPEIRRRR